MMILFLLYFAIAVLSCLVVGLILYARWNYGVLERLNIPVVKRSFFMGSTPDLHLKVQHYEDIERFKKYGSVYGVYEGRKPQIHVCDIELAKLILIKDYEYFHNRREIDLGDPILNELPDFLRGDKWKIMRNAQTPFFTMAKMKSMKYTLKECADEFCKTLQDESQFTDQLNISSLVDGCLMDVFARCAFGIKLGDSSSSEQRQSFVQLFKDLMGQNDDFGLLYTLSMTFPFLVKFSPTLNGDVSQKIADILKSIIDSRKKSGQKLSDFIEVLSDMYDKLTSPEYKNSGITESTIMAQGIGLVLAGYDSMTTGLSVLVYYLSKYPEIQEKLAMEIEDFVEEHNGEIAFENMNELHYLHACLTEAYRLVPPFIRPERECTKDWEYNGIKIKKGMTVMVPAWAIHRNPDLFPDPDAFDPERFMPDNKTQMEHNFFSFGHGPRNCIGKRFAYEISKYIMCNVLRQFKIECVERTRLNFKKGVLFLVMYEPIYVNLVKR